ncbi:ABC transporter transmembrane domain-containing protein [Chelativorans sp. AA-79]|uniref:ABC transporter transmembrane domain-containing protein n=1 Tax=Chelativorans sp. AA-79 TaxID=3028735 RepID=UPI0023FA3BAC|nr:ABC transporter transmembrane domain-containing protein [Chelativorans sp. AA-79]WEX09980.1 ABC transporter transmembrane domain-containing protein [Chelativorans sp. AA-79]
MASIPAAQEGKSRRSLKPLRRLLPYLRRYRGLALGAGFFLLVAALAMLALPQAVRRVIDHGFSDADAAFVSLYFSALLLVAAILAVASACRYYFVITLGERIVADLRRDVFAHVTRLSPSFFDKAQSGEIVSRLTADATQIKSGIGATASQAARNTVMGLGAVVMMVVTSPRLSAFAVAAIPIIVLPLVAFGRSVRQRSRRAQDTLAEATAFASEQIGAVRVLQAFTNEERAAGRFGAAVDAAFEAARTSIFARAFLTFFVILGASFAVVAVLWVGSQDVLDRTMTAGTLVQFVLYAVLAAGALSGLSEVGGELAQAAGAAERMVELLEEKPAIATPTDPIGLPAPARGAVRFRDVCFAYPSRPDHSALHQLSFEVVPGETVAIVGPSGAGKSTIFSLLLRYYDPDEGSVLIDDLDISRADPRAVRERIAIVPQDVTVFSASAAENIAFGRPGATREEVEAAARAALAHDFIMALENGYDTQVGERGVMLSGGQRQRLAIARAILRDAPILLLDEATSALDAESETLVQKALERLMQGRTTIVIAHRLATILKADRILVLEDGRVIEEGGHADLVARGGVYARLASLQFEAGADVFKGAAE